MSNDRFEELLTRYLDGSLEPHEWSELERHMAGDEALLKRLLDVTHTSAMLEQKAAIEGVDRSLLERLSEGTPRKGSLAASDAIAEALPAPRLFGPFSGTMFGLSAFAALLMVSAWLMHRGGVGHADARRSVCRVHEIGSVEWANEGRPRGADVAAGARLAVAAGRLWLEFPDGTDVFTTGPTELVVTSDQLVELRHGTVAAKVSEASARHFRIATPTTRILDLGTEFGVDVAPEGGETEVVVFEGAVQLEEQGETSGHPTILELGDSVRVTRDRRLERVAAVFSDKYPLGGGKDAAQTEGVIRAIGDNLRDDETIKGYRVVHRGMQEDALAYVDRMDEWNGLTSRGIPEFLIGADYIMPFVEAGRSSGLALDIEVGCDAYIYLLVDDRADRPAWMAERFDDTGHDIGLDQGYTLTERTPTETGPGKSIDRVFSVLRATAREGETIRLRGLSDNDSAMYSVCLTPMDKIPSPERADTSELIGSVTDNIRSDSDRGYRVFSRGMREDALAYSDRIHEWNGFKEAGLPDFLIETDYVATYNDDRFVEGYKLSLDLKEECVVYLLWDKRVPLAEWVNDQFVDTGATVGMDEGVTPRYVWQKSHGPGKSIERTFWVMRSKTPRQGKVELGAMGLSDRLSNMYGVAVRAAAETPHEHR